MTHIWPDLGVAPVPTVLSMICKPDAVVMVFPAVWAAAMGGTHIDEAPMTAIVTADSIEILASFGRRISRHLSFEIETYLAQPRRRCHPVRHAKRRAGNLKPGDCLRAKSSESRSP